MKGGSIKKGFAEICVFLVKVYMEAWILASMSIQASYKDLRFLKRIYSYKAILDKFSRAFVNKFLGLLWYLGEETVAMSFFDPWLNDEVMNRMVNALNSTKRSL